jgi:hypothetical protein
MPRILVKAAPGLAVSRLSFGAAPVEFKATRLFESIDAQPGIGAAAGEVWHVLTPPPGFGEANAWEICHSLMQQGFGVAGATAPAFAEPDIEQRWITGKSSEGGQSLVQSCEAADPQSTDFPLNDEDNYWFRATSHSQFDDAIAAIGGPNVASKVRVAHFDTGYDPDHHTLPKRLRDKLARNFVDADRPNDATDRTSGLFTNLGHGTGTLSLLAGTALPGQSLLGGAPFAEIVPVRVANSVVLFSNSAIAQAFDYVHKLNIAGTNRVDIITMSMGGLASQAWADAVNALYEQGVFIVTAAGNNFGNLPTRNIVYPARFNRVVAACGVMGDGKPYADLSLRLMAGNYGPNSKMGTAIAAPTPNVPWARLGCRDIIDFDGQGTSAATPQVAAAAAVWLQQNRASVDAYPQGWMKVEAIRKALFDAAKLNQADIKHLGRGELRANDALGKAPAEATALHKTGPDTVSFPIFQVLTGLGMQAASAPQQRMLELEALQLSQSASIEAVMPDDPSAATPAELRRVADALAADPRASKALRDAIGSVAARDRVSVSAAPAPGTSSLEQLHLVRAANPKPRQPSSRQLRVYAYDPSIGARLETVDINEAILNVRWEEGLKPGPVGEYIEVVDIDPPSQCCYAPVDLDNRHILAQSGISPSEANPQFHQQMVYAVSMKTIEHFEKALGRVALWAPRRTKVDGKWKTQYTQRLRIYPHALRTKNAYYSPERTALLLGYFTASSTNAGTTLPGGVVFTALSHDIVAHETTHALLHGLHLRSIEATNLDVFAFHEAFADIVALFQHFTMPEALKHQIAATQGDLEKKNLLGQLALQFGEATDRYGALRDYIGKVTKVEETGKSGGRPQEKPVWVRSEASRTDYEQATEPHDRGAVLVTAVFNAFLQIYKRRKADLLRLATNGSGVLPAGEISVDLVNRLADEASKVAGHILGMCIRALDYCPPVDLTFGEYFRALITADTDLVPVDKHGYRVAFIEAFRDRGIYPRDVKSLSPDSLLWEPPPSPLNADKLQAILKQLTFDWERSVGREKAFDQCRKNAKEFWHWLMSQEVTDEEIENLGLERIRDLQPSTVDGVPGKLHLIEVHSIRPARRVGPDGNIQSDIVVEITQTFIPDAVPNMRIRSGCTLLINWSTFRIRYLIRKRLRIGEQIRPQLVGAAGEENYGLRDNYYDDGRILREPFAFVHGAHG